MAERRIGGAGGGSDKGGGASTTVVTMTLGLTLALGVGGTATVGGAVVGSGAAASGSSGASVSLRVQTRVGKQSSRAARDRLQRQGVRVRARSSHDTSDCAGHAYGQLVDFFHANPCVGLHRALFELRDARGDVVLLAVAWVEMPDEGSAVALHRLVDTDGTGNLTELSRERGRYKSIRFTGDLYASRRDGRVVANAQLQPVARGGAGLAFTAILTDALA